MAASILSLLAAVAFGLWIVEGHATGEGLPFMDAVVFCLLTAIACRLRDIEKELRKRR